MAHIIRKWRTAVSCLTYLSYQSYPSYQELNAPARISGRVVSGETGLPLRGAVVELIGGGAISIATDADGRFEFSQRRVGSYALRASKAGYVPSVFGGLPGEGDQFEVLAGRRIDRGAIRLQRASVISGRVTDQFGEPVGDASVVAYRIEFPQPGIRTWQMIKEAATNDLGEYRIHGLKPGQYHVSASRVPLPPEFRVAMAGGQFRAIDAELEYALTGGSVVSAKSQSEPIVVNTAYAGETSGMNLTLPHKRRVRVSGTVLDSAGKPVSFVSVSLRPAEPVARQFDIGGTQVRTKEGEFLFTNVAVGEYSLTVTAEMLNASPPTSAGAVPVSTLPSETASMTLSVNDDISGLRVQTSQLKRRPFVTGRVLIDGAPVETGIRLRYVMLPLGQQPLLAPGLGDGSIVTTQTMARGPVAMGRFIIPGAGRVVLRYAGSPGVTLKSVVSNGVDVTDGFDVTEADVTVEVHLTTQGSALKGVVKEMDGNAAVDREVLVFSAEPSFWQLPLSRRMAIVRADDKGEFQFAGFPAGEYVAVAVNDLDRAMWAEPARLELLRPFATPFSVSDATTTTVALVVKR